jgi:eukaryotic-like serine/threonine-protein kinase
MTLALKAGTVLAGKYVLEREIGRGGAGVVMSAQHTMLRQRVALKFLRQELLSEPEVIGRFLREAQASALLRGTHVARVMDACQLESGEAFLVMEYIEGRDLAAVLAQDGPLPIADAVDYLLQTCEGVAEAHAVGMIHRDLKPGNLFLTRAPDGSPLIKVLDFGLSKFTTSDSCTPLTADHHVIGSPHFMSPEQMRSSRDVDHRSDIWALGAVLFTLLSGQYPYRGRLLTEICIAVFSGDLQSLCALRPDVPPALAAVVERCLHTQPDERYDSVASLASALAPFAPPRALPRAGRVRRVLNEGRRSVAPPAPRASQNTPATTIPSAARSSAIAAAPSAPPSFAPSASVSHSAPLSSTALSEAWLLPDGAADLGPPPWARSSPPSGTVTNVSIPVTRPSGGPLEPAHPTGPPTSCDPPSSSFASAEMMGRGSTRPSGRRWRWGGALGALGGVAIAWWGLLGGRGGPTLPPTSIPLSAVAPPATPVACAAPAAPAASSVDAPPTLGPGDRAEAGTPNSDANDPVARRDGRALLRGSAAQGLNAATLRAPSAPKQQPKASPPSLHRAPNANAGGDEEFIKNLP